MLDTKRQRLRFTTTPFQTTPSINRTINRPSKYHIDRDHLNRGGVFHVSTKEHSFESFFLSDGRRQVSASFFHASVTTLSAYIFILYLWVHQTQANTTWDGETQPRKPETAETIRSYSDFEPVKRKITSTTIRRDSKHDA